MKLSFKAWFLLTAITWPLAFLIGKKAQNSSPSSRSLPATKSNAITTHKSALFQSPAQTAIARTLSTTESIQSLRTQADFQTAIADLIKFSDKTEKERYLALLFEHWLNTDPSEALHEVRQVEMLRSHGRRTALAFENWATENPIAATQLLQQALASHDSNLSTLLFRDKIDPPAFILSLFSGLAHTDPQAAGNVLASTPESLIRQEFLSSLAQIWFQQNPTQAYHWVTTLPDDTSSIRSQALHEISTRAGLSPQPQSGIDWANTFSNPEERTLALKEITTQWSQKNARTAYNWASTLPDSDPAKFEVMPSVISRLTLIDPGLAADWLNQYQASPQMDASIAAYAITLRTINQTAALGSIEAITDPTLKAQIKNRIEATP